MSRKVRQEIFTSLPAIDGRGEIFDWVGNPLETPWTQEYRDRFVRYELYPNSLEALKLGVLQPVAVTHNDPTVARDPFARGRATGFYVAKRSEPVPHYVLIADMEVEDDFYETLEDGKLPGCSPEFPLYGDFTGFGGGKVGAYISAITYNSADPVAMPWMTTLDPELNNMGAIQFCQFKALNTTITPVNSTAKLAILPATEEKPTEKDTNTMTPEEKAGLLEEIKALVTEICASMIEAKAGDEEADLKADMAAKAALAAQTPDKEPEATDSAIADMAQMKAEFAALKAELAATKLKADKAEFAALGIDSKAHPKAEEEFLAFAAVAGLDSAKAMFARLKAPVVEQPRKPGPPQRALFNITQPTAQSSANDEQAMRNSGISEADIKAHMALRAARAKKGA